MDFETFSKSDFRAVKIKSCEEVKKSDKLLKFVLNDGSGEDRVILSGIKKYYDPSELVGKTAIAIVNLPPRKMMGEYSNGMLISAVNEYDGEEMLNLLLVDDRIPAERSYTNTQSEKQRCCLQNTGNASILTG